MSGRCARVWTTWPQADEPLREEMNRWLAEEGLGALAEKLRELDPEYYQIVDLNNPARVVRALEVCLQTGMPYSRQRTGERREPAVRNHQNRHRPAA